MKDLSSFSDLFHKNIVDKAQIAAGFVFNERIDYLSSNSDMNKFAYAGAHIVPIAQPLI